MATVKLFGNLRTLVNASHLQISGTSVRSVIAALCEKHPNLCSVLLEAGQIRPHFKITLNGHDIRLESDLDTPTNEEDQIAIFSPIAGG